MPVALKANHAQFEALLSQTKTLCQGVDAHMKVRISLNLLSLEGWPESDCPRICRRWRFYTFTVSVVLLALLLAAVRVETVRLESIRSLAVRA